MNKTTLNLIFLLLTFFLLFKDFKSTTGYKKQKTFHFLAIIFLLCVYSNSIRYVISPLSNFSDFMDKSYIQNGIYKPWLSLLVNLTTNILSAIIFISAIGLIFRKEYWRKNIVIIMPFLVVLSIPSFYIGFVNQKEELKQTYMIVSIVLLLIDILIYYIYRSEFMRQFFELKKL